METSNLKDILDNIKVSRKGQKDYVTSNSHEALQESHIHEVLGSLFGNVLPGPLVLWPRQTDKIHSCSEATCHIPAADESIGLL